MTAQTTSQIMRPKQAAPYLGVSVTTLWRLEQTDPDFPRKVRFSARCVGFRQADIDAYLQKKIGGAA